VLGLDAAGKTTIINKVKFGEVVSSEHTIGSNVETIRYKNLNVNIWEMGGGIKMRKLWEHYYEYTDAIIYVVDNSDSERMVQAKEILLKVLSDDKLTNCPLLIFANKTDISNMTVPEIVSSMDL
jgi:ADP-ribosylation factor protein 1